MKPSLSAWLRSALFAGWMFLSAIVIGLGSLPLLLGPARLAMAPIRRWAQLQLWALRWMVGLEVEVRGREHLPAGPVLIACKHQSMLDTLLAMTLTPWPCIVLKRELMAIPIFGWFARKAGMIAIDREGGPAEVRRMIERAQAALAQGRSVVIYPEGTRRAPGAAPAYKGGVGLLYRELGVACLPIATDSGVNWPAHGLAKQPGRSTFDILQPIPPDESRRVFMRRLEAGIEAASSRLLTSD